MYVQVVGTQLRKEMCGENSSPSVRFSFYAPLRISLALSHFALRFLFHALLFILRSASHFTLLFSFHTPLLISRSASHFTPASHFTLRFSFYAPRLISRPSTDFMFLPRPEYMERASPFDENICSSNVVLCVLQCFTKIFRGAFFIRGACYRYQLLLVWEVFCQ